MESKFVGIAHLTQHLLRPARGGAAAVVVVFAVLLGICARSLFGLPLELILGSWFFKYAFILFDNTYRGFDEPPVLDINMMNPYGEMRPVGQLLILAAMVGAVVLAYLKVGVALSVVLVALFLLILPATVAVLGIEGSLLKALNPAMWIEMISGLGMYYLVVLALIALEIIVVVSLGKLPLGIVFQCAAVMFGVLSGFSLIGGALYERRDQLGLTTWASPERDEELQRREDHRQDEKTITDAYGLVRANQHQQSWETLQAWLHSQSFSLDAYRWLIEQTDKWEDSRYANRLTEDWVERAMLQKKSGDALKVVVERLRADSAFRPKSAADTLALAQLAARGGGSPRTARTLLSDFAARFPGDPRQDTAAALARHLS